VRAASVQLDGATVAELETKGSVILANFEPASERAKATLTTPSPVTRHCRKFAQAACPLSPGRKLYRYTRVADECDNGVHGVGDPSA
jgi:hypothetical protein